MLVFIFSLSRSTHIFKPYVFEKIWLLIRGLFPIIYITCMNHETQLGYMHDDWWLYTLHESETRVESTLTL